MSNAFEEMIVTDRQGIEYAVVKPNRVNWVVRRLSDGAMMQNNKAAFTMKEFRVIEKDPTAPTYRVGSLVKVPRSARVRNHKRWNFRADQVFVLIKDNGGEVFKMVPVGGSEMGTVWTVPSNNFEKYDFAG